MESENSDIRSCISCGQAGQPNDKFCPNCGMQLNTVNDPIIDATYDPSYISWENYGDYSPIKALHITFKELFLHPWRFFEKLNASSDLGNSVTFFMAVLVYFSFFYSIVFFVFSTYHMLSIPNDALSKQQYFSIVLTVALIFYFFIISILIFFVIFSSVALGAWCKLLAFKNIKYSMILKIVIYSSIPFILASPLIYLFELDFGLSIIAIWSLILVYIGISKAGEKRFIKALYATLIPWVLSFWLIYQLLLEIRQTLAD